jgi:2,4-dienoyl-CoA reductase-like NADH-dependent reductase (Old Yellow Enzyme family)
MCDSDGRPSKKLIAFYRLLAQGGVGFIITGYTFIRPDGKQLSGKMGISARLSVFHATVVSSRV